MLLTVWTKPSGYSFGTVQEQQTVHQVLPVANDSGVTYTVISGSLPSGLRIDGNTIVGTPYITANITTSLFCIRASRGSDFADRTFTMSVNGANPPEFITPAGELVFGPHRQMYVLDSSIVSYQIEVTNINSALGNSLRFFISSGDGDLPPGLSLSSDGVISGFTEPVYSNSTTVTTTSTSGFDSFNYDRVFFDYNLPAVVPNTLNVNYQFKVTVTDGVSYAQQVFRIFVVSTDEFRADSTVFNGFAGEFTADSTFLRQPVWITDAKLGTLRANNYITVPIAVYNRDQIQLRLEATNEEVYAVTHQLSNTDNVSGSYYVTVSNVKGVPIYGQSLTFDGYVDGASSTKYNVVDVTDLSNNTYRIHIDTQLELNLPNGLPFYIGSLSQLPPGTAFDENTGDLYGRIPYQPYVIKNYTFTLTAIRTDPVSNESVSASKTFNIDILGDVTSLIIWNTGSDLGSIPANYICTLSVNATNNDPNAIIFYHLIGGTLPPGVKLSSDGELTGTVNQFYDQSKNLLGLTTFDGGDMTFDYLHTPIDRVYTFTIQASDQYGYSAVDRTFSVGITTPNTVPYSNITTAPFLVPAQRSAWQSFINNAEIFTPDSIYRTNDANFGIQTKLSMLVYAGIQTVDAAAYIGAMGLNHKRKRFTFGSIKKAVAIDPDTKNSVYEVIYVQMIDPYESNGSHLPLSIRNTTGLETPALTVDNSTSIWSRNLSDLTSIAPSSERSNPLVTVDSTGYEVSNPKPNMYFPNNISNWQTRLKDVGLTERNYLPLWMRTIQSGSKQQLGYVLAIPICFCKVGTADTILKNIQYSGFDFKTIDYTVDRFTISAVTGNSSDKYLIFRNDRITV